MRLECLVERDPAGGIATVRPRGGIGLREMLEVREALVAALREGYTRQLLDLSAVRHLSTESVGILVERQDRTRAAGGQLILVAPPGPIRERLAAAGAYASLDVAATAAEGWAVLASTGVAAG